MKKNNNLLTIMDEASNLSEEDFDEIIKKMDEIMKKNKVYHGRSNSIYTWNPLEGASHDE
jgi:hypothetical protein